AASTPATRAAGAGADGLEGHAGERADAVVGGEGDVAAAIDDPRGGDVRRPVRIAADAAVHVVGGVDDQRAAKDADGAASAAVLDPLLGLDDISDEGGDLFS